MEEKEKEEGEKLASFFGAIYELLNPVPVPVNAVAFPVPVDVPVSVSEFVPVALPARFVPVDFVPPVFCAFSPLYDNKLFCLSYVL